MKSLKLRNIDSVTNKAQSDGHSEGLPDLVQNKVTIDFDKVN